MHWTHEPLVIAYVFFFGSAWGSFLNVLIYRLPREISVLRKPPSSCPGCSTPIRWYDNLPIVSWLALRGRCRQCKTRISIRYPLVEATAGLMCVAALLKWGISVTGIEVLIFSWVSLALGLIDFDFQILPDTLTYEGSLTPEQRQRGIYRVQVYTADLVVSGEFRNLHAAVEKLSSAERLESVDWSNGGRILPNQRIGKFPDPGAGSRPEGGEVERPQWTDLTISGQAIVGDQLDDSTIEHLYELALRPRISALDQRQVHLVNANRGNFHVAPFLSGLASIATKLNQT